MRSYYGKRQKNPIGIDFVAIRLFREGELNGSDTPWLVFYLTEIRLLRITCWGNKILKERRIGQAIIRLDIDSGVAYYIEVFLSNQLIVTFCTGVAMIVILMILIS